MTTPAHRHRALEPVPHENDQARHRHHCGCGALICNDDIPTRRGSVWHCILTAEHAGLCDHPDLPAAQLYWKRSAAPAVPPLTPDEMKRLGRIPVHIAGNVDRMSESARAALGRMIFAAADELGETPDA